MAKLTATEVRELSDFDALSGEGSELTSEQMSRYFDLSRRR